MGILEGIIPAAVTPFDAEERFVPAAYEALLARLYAAGVHGVYVCGGTGAPSSGAATAVSRGSR